MKNFIIKIIEHPVSIATLVLAAAAAADITTCSVERMRLNRAIRKGKPYHGSDYQGLICKQKIAKYTPPTSAK